MNNEPPYLHLYAQKYQHANAKIVGTREALIKLRDVISAALIGLNEESCLIDVYANDGEEYSLFVRCIEEGQFLEYKTPYTQGE
jgi:hypothetical protein